MSKWNKPGITMLRGLPASGKTTYAKDIAQRYENVKRINKDDLRAMLDGGQFSRPNEKFVLIMRNTAVAHAIVSGHHVIVDDTNFVKKHEDALRIQATRYDCPFYIKDFETPVQECIYRDAQRENSVGPNVIWDMYTRHVQHTEGRKPKDIKEFRETIDNNRKCCVIWDLDGTLATHDGIRGHHEYDKVLDDAVNAPIASLFAAISEFHDPIFVSGRPDSCKEQTQRWLRRHGLWKDNAELYMRKEGDWRADSIIKQEIWEEIKDKHQVIAVFDDRTRVVEMWRNQGLACMQVNWGDF